MNVTRDEAAKALEEIGAAGGRMQRLSLYADMAPMFMLWGLIWFGANLVTEFRPAYSSRAWLAGMIVGFPLTIYLTVRQARRSGARIRQAGGDPKLLGTRMALLGAISYAFFAAIFAVTPPVSPRQVDAFISLFFAFAYALGGVWGGWRLIAIGAATAAAILFGYFALTQHFFLWMAVVGGGALVAGGLWLRKA
ncbi:MAG TPA: hypothetical protein VHX64_06765 [Caulobacteraceae bacterium]|jgi:hypothetical protein|nr:hypothetical protein [Caulobacteraceae bacterium]